MTEARGTTHYGRLGLDADASTDEIRRAYRSKAKVAHPDAGGDADEFRLLLMAYEVLSDEGRRREYDLSIGIKQPLSGMSTSGAAVKGWGGTSGDFNGNVGFPAWMSNVTDAQWRPPAEGEARETDFARHERERAAEAAARSNARPANVVWWWPDRAIAAPVLGGTLLIAAAERSVVAIDPFGGGEVWRASTADRVLGRPAVAGHTVVAWTGDGVIHGFDLGTGLQRWETTIGPPAPAGVRTDAAGSTLIGARKDARVFAMDAATGKALWAGKLAGAAAETMAIADGIVVVTTGRTIEALETRKGKHRWQVPSRHPSLLPPVLTPDTVWLASGTEAGSLLRLDGATGKIEAASRLGNAIGGMVADGAFLVASVAGPSRIVILDEFGRQLLEAPTDRVCPEPAVGPSALYVVDPDGQLLTFDRATGVLTSRVSLPFVPRGAPQLIGDRVIILEQDGRIWATAT